MKKKSIVCGMRRVAHKNSLNVYQSNIHTAHTKNDVDERGKRSEQGEARRDIEAQLPA